MLDDYKKYSDAELVQRYQKGDSDAVNFLLQRYRTPLHGFFRKRIKGNRKEDIEDLVQETLLQVWQRLEKLRSPESFRAWFYTIAQRLLNSWIATQRKQSLVMAPEGVPDDEFEQPSLAEFFFAPVMDQPEHATLDNELGHIRRRFEQTLQPEELRIFKSRLEEDKSFKEIAEELGIKPEAARVRFHRINQAFKTWLEKHYPDTYRMLSGGG